MAPPATVPLDPAPLRAAGSGRAVLLKLGAFVVGLAAAVHFALVTNGRFLAWCEEASGEDALPLRLEATLRGLPRGQFDVLVVGNSVAESHIHPEQLLVRHRVRALPIALYGGTMVDLAMLAPHLARPRPRAVAVLATSWTVFDHFEWRDLRIYDPDMAWRIFSARELVASPRDHASLLLGSRHFVIRHRASIRDSLLRQLVPGAGHDVMYDRWGAGPRRRRAVREAATREQLRCPSVGSRALAALARRLSEDGIRVVIVPTPGNGPWDRSPEVLALFDGCVGAVAAETGAKVIERGALPAPSPADFRDRQHLNAAAAERFTDAVGAELSRLVPPKDGDALQ